MKKLFIILFAPTLFISCGGSDESAEGESTSSDSTTIESDLVFDQNDYAVDWMDFQMALIVDDTVGIDYFNETAYDAEFVMSIICVDFVKEEIDNMAYEELEETDYNGELLKMFFAEEIYEEEGEEYGSSIALYFKETAHGLRLVDFMAAG